MTNSDLKAFIAASKAKASSGSSRTSEAYSKAVKLLLKLAKARKYAFFNLADFYASLKSAGLIKGSVPDKEEYGYKNFRIGYVYPKTKKVINGTRTNALSRAGNFYFCTSGDAALIVPETNWSAYREKLMKIDTDFVKLLEANYKFMYPTDKLAAVKAAVAASSSEELDKAEKAVKDALKKAEK